MILKAFIIISDRIYCFFIESGESIYDPYTTFKIHLITFAMQQIKRSKIKLLP